MRTVVLPWRAFACRIAFINAALAYSSWVKKPASSKPDVDSIKEMQQRCANLLVVSAVVHVLIVFRTANVHGCHVSADTATELKSVAKVKTQTIK